MTRFHWSREGWALVLSGLLLFCFLSLLSYDAADLAEWHHPPNPVAENWCGPAGARLAAVLFQWFGIGALLGLLVAAAWARRLLLASPVDQPWLRSLGTLLLGLMICATLGLLPGPHESSRMPGYGGIAGVALDDFLQSYFGTAGTFLVVTLLLLLSFLLATDMRLIEAAGLASQGMDHLRAGRAWRFHLRRRQAEPMPPPGTAPASRDRVMPPPSALPPPASPGGPLPAGGPRPLPASPGQPVPPAGMLPAGSGQPGKAAAAASAAPPWPEPLPGDAPIVDGEPADEDSRGEYDPDEDDLPAVPPTLRVPAAAAGSDRREVESSSAPAGGPPEAAPPQPADPEPSFPEAQPPHLDLESIVTDSAGEVGTSRAGSPGEQSLAADGHGNAPGEASAPRPETLPADAAATEHHPAGPETIGEGADAVSAGGGPQHRPSPVAGEDAADRPGGPIEGGSGPAEESGSDSRAEEAVAGPARGVLFPGLEDSREAKDGDSDFDVAMEEDAPARIEQKIESLRSSGALADPVRGRAASRPKKGKYTLPPLDLLDRPAVPKGRELESRQKVQQLETALQNFSVGAEVVDIQRGPTVTLYEIALAPGVKVNKVVNLSDDLAIAMRAQSVRIVAPIPGKSTVGIEIPNSVKEVVRLRELMECQEAEEGEWVLPLFLGKDVAGSPIIADLTQMPHLLIAGATGSGKSVAINALITSILMTQTPDDVRLILVDPKMVELSGFEDIPHLLSPVVTDMKKAPGVLEWAVKKMDERYDILASVGVRHIKQFNQLGEDKIRKRLAHRGWDQGSFPFHLPYIVVVVDEYADLMMVSPKELEKSITRLAQKSRAVGIHVVLATQRPSVDVITGLIKSNMTTRIAFSVTSKVDSRTILDRNGAEKLVGQGDMLYLPPGKSDLIRSQGSYAGDEELRRIVNFLRAQDNPEYEAELQEMDDLESDVEDFGQRDSLYDQAVRIILQTRRGSVSLLQRKLEIGYTRAARLMDFMAKEGIVGGYKGSKAREVLLTLEEWEAARSQPGKRDVPDSPDLEDRGEKP